MSRPRATNPQRDRSPEHPSANDVRHPMIIGNHTVRAHEYRRTERDCRRAVLGYDALTEKHIAECERQRGRARGVATGIAVGTATYARPQRSLALIAEFHGAVNEPPKPRRADDRGSAMFSSSAKPIRCGVRNSDVCAGQSDRKERREEHTNAVHRLCTRHSAHAAVDSCRSIEIEVAPEPCDTGRGPKSHRKLSTIHKYQFPRRYNSDIAFTINPSCLIPQFPSR